MDAAELAAQFPRLSAAPGKCRVCGCTEDHACVDPEHGPCWWVEPGLCSHCAEPRILMAEYDRLQAQWPNLNTALQQRDHGRALVTWSLKARAALERVSFTAWDAFEV